MKEEEVMIFEQSVMLLENLMFRNLTDCGMEMDGQWEGDGRWKICNFLLHSNKK